MKVTVEALASEIEKILNEYGDEVKKNLDEILMRTAKVGANLLKSESSSKFGGTGKYARGWTVTEEKNDRWGSTYVIHNRVYNLPHLLEFGHAKRNGGRVAGRPHIKPVEERLITQVEQEVVAKL